MKKTLFIILTILLFQSNNVKSQITLDTIFEPLMGIGYDFFPTQISPTETKYVFCDYTNNTFSLYNMNFTPFMSNIPVPEPFLYQSNLVFQVMYITRTLFDCDSSNIEFVYEDALGITNPFYVMRTDGTQLLKVDSANGPYCIGGCQGLSDYTRPIRNTSDGAKLFLQKPNAFGYQKILIYSLCDSLITDVFDLTEQKQLFVKLYPNPTTSSLTFQINPPDNINQYELVILDNTAKEVKRQKLIYSTNKYTIDFADLSSGLYYYTLCSKIKVLQSGKFIVTK